MARKALVLLVPLWLAAARSAAQDTQYWSIQYGPVGQLLGGQVIGGVPDLSATFYNPGSLALRSESSFLVSAQSVQREIVSVVPPPGFELFDTSSSRFGAAPSLLAGVLPRWLGQQTSLAWSYLTRQQLDAQLGQRLSDPLSSDFETSAAEIYFEQSLSESWGGLTLARPLSSSMGLGLTLYGVYRGQRTRSEVSAQALADGASALAAASGVSDFEYGHFRALAKLGLAWEQRGWRLGGSVTTPSVPLFGSGTAAYNISVSGVDRDGDGQPDPPILETATADGLRSYYRSSWAIGVGASRAFGKARVHASAEWFAPVGRFEVLDLPDSSANAGELTQQLDSVLNGGVAVEYTLASHVSLYGAFHTDYSAAAGSATANVTISDWDIYHASAGTALRIGDNRITLGVLWAFGSETRPLDTPLPPEDVPDLGLGRPAEIRYSKLTLLLGFEFGK